jgi:hypothetical protein
MTVKELIDMLSEYPPDAIVISPSSNYELKGENVAAHCYAVNVVRRSERFMDDFDHEPYHATVYRPAREKGEANSLMAIRIYGSGE